MATTLLAPGCCCAGFCRCLTCDIPQNNMTVSWTNVIIGNGSTPLIYTAPCTWASACAHQLLYVLVCTGGVVELQVYYFVSGSCPTGQSQYCSTIRSSPFALTRTGLTCGTNFLMTVTVGGGCTNLATNGYIGFTVSNP